MLKNRRDENYLNVLIQYCDKIESTIGRLNYDKNNFIRDYDFQQSICFSLSQIGETVNKLSGEFKNEYNKVPWNAIKGMRNMIVHEYGIINLNTVWETAISDIVELKKYCIDIQNQIQKEDLE